MEYCVINRYYCDCEPKYKIWCQYTALTDLPSSCLNCESHAFRGHLTLALKYLSKSRTFLQITRNILKNITV